MYLSRNPIRFGRHCSGKYLRILVPFLFTAQLLLSVVVCAQDSLTTNERRYVDATNEFAFDLYRNLANSAGRDENVAFSPFSISIGVAMLAVGARGETAEEILKALHLQSAQTVQAALPQVLRRVKSEDAKASLAVDVGLWYDDDYPLRREFGMWFRDSCGAKDHAANFQSAIGRWNARRTMNGWVKKLTAGKIPTLLEDNDIDEATRAVLVNALLFQGKWTYPFLPETTTERVFLTLNGQTVAVPMMEQLAKANTLRAAETATCQMLELPYGEGRYSMLILLPREPDGLLGLDTTLNLSTWRQWTAELAMAEQGVALQMPRYQLHDRRYINDALKTLGIVRLFGLMQADLSGMFATRDLFVSRAIHALDLEVDETGTVAAAATAFVIAIGRTDDSPVIFHVDRPYAFVIVDNATQAILVMGRIVNPIAAQ